jgi:hypothetical protein
MENQNCIICSKDISKDDKYIKLTDGLVHLDCWITRLFKKNGVDRELLGQFALLLDYSLSQISILREIKSTHPSLSSKIDMYEEIIGKEVDLLSRFVIEEILGGDEY